MYKLMEVLRNNKISNTEIAELLGIKSQSTISLKLHGKFNFTLNEAYKLICYINEKTNGNYTIEELFVK